MEGTFGTVIFVCTGRDTDNIKRLVQENPSFIEQHVLDIQGPYKFSLAEEGILYKVRFSTEQWLNINDMQAILEDNGYEADIVHTVYNDEFVMVDSTSSYYDDFTNDPKLMEPMLTKFGYEVDADEVLVDFDDDEDDEEPEDFDEDYPVF